MITTSLIITISGFTIVWVLLTLLVIIAASSYLKKDREYIDSELNKTDLHKKYLRDSSHVLVFEIENNSDETILLDLCRLDDKDSRYKFSVSLQFDYETLVSYLKSYSLNVLSTRIQYNKSNKWQYDVIYHNSITPFAKEESAIFLAFNNFNKNQFQKNIIDSEYPYVFDYFNSLDVTLNPHENKAIVLHITDGEIDVKHKHNPVCALIVRNNSDKVERIKLFDKEYYNEISEVGKIEINTPFRHISYNQVMAQNDAQPLIAKQLKMFIGDRNSGSTFKINFDEHKIADYIEPNQFQHEVVDFDLKDDKYIALFEIDVEPNSTIYIAFND